MTENGGIVVNSGSMSATPQLLSNSYESPDANKSWLNSAGKLQGSGVGGDGS